MVTTFTSIQLTSKYVATYTSGKKERTKNEHMCKCGETSFNMGSGCGKYQNQASKVIRLNSSHSFQREANQSLKVLILGAAESGKSTLCRHIRGIHGDNFSEDEVLLFKRHIRISSINIFANILQGLLEENFEEFLSKHLCVEFLQDYRSRSLDSYDRKFLETAVQVWRFYSVQKYILKIINSTATENGSGFIMYARNYSDNPSNQFLPSFSRIMSKGYKPTLDDILSVRIPTIGIKETHFKRENRILCLIDVGGQRSERRKWIHHFDGVNALIFVIAMSEYDQVLLEDCEVNRMQESLQLFNKICRMKWFLYVPLLLFLNKKDVFEEKIVHSPLTICFKEYTGGSDKSKASEYILEQCKKENNVPDRQLYSHFTCAKDSDNIHCVFDMAIDTVIMQNLLRTSIN